MKFRVAALTCLVSTCVLALFTGVAQAAAAFSGSDIFQSIIGFLVGGMALDLTPCVYPLIPVTISYFSTRAADEGAGRGRTVAHALLYVLGIAVMNSLLGVFAALSGRLLGTVLENPMTLVFVALVMVMFALSMFGVWEFRLPAFITNAATRNYAGLFGSLVMGLTLGIVAAPCIGPFVLGILMFVAQSRDPVFGFWVFFSLSLGMGFPLFVLALLSGQLEKLPKSGEWMVWVRKAMGWVMIGAAAYFLSALFTEMFGTALLVATALAAAVHLGWLEPTAAGSAVFRRVRRGFAICCVLVAGVLVWNAIPGESVRWIDYSDKALTDAKESGMPVIIDFFAEWCSPCRHLDKVTFHDRSVIEAAAKDFIMIRVDLTESGDPAKERLVRSYNVRGVPTVVFLKPGGDEMTDLRVMSSLPPDKFLSRMNQLKASIYSRKGP